MAIVDDIKADKRTKNVLNQTNTKTVGPPPSTTGLIGDSLPDEVFTVGDFDLVRNQINLEAANFQLLDSLNTMGQITNTQSVSGPIPSTCSIKQVTATSDGVVSVFQPDPGTVFLLMGGSVGGSGGGNRSFILIDDGTVSDFEIADETVTSGQQNPWDPLSGAGPFYLDNGTTLKANITSVSGTAVIKAYVVRVR